MPFGTRILEHGVSFQIWAPSAKHVSLCLYTDGDKTILPMEPAKDGRFTVTSEIAKAGMRYHYVINHETYVPDPASRFQPEDVHGPSEIIDPSAFAWKNNEWKGRPWEEAIFYEIHVGTFSTAGTFKGVQEHLDQLVDLGITTLEIMPLADFPGSRGWGYDGVLPFAVESSYGRPEDLKELIQTAHQKGLMVFLDVVFNHFGPDGNYFHAFAEQFFNGRHKTPWGPALNFDAEDKEIVRDFFIQNALYWLNEYRFDGLRLDAVDWIEDDSPYHFLKELADTVNESTSHNQIHMMLENGKNQAVLLERDGRNYPRYYAAQWSDDIHHAYHVLATGESTGYYEDYQLETSGRAAIDHLGVCLTQGFAYQGQYSKHQNKKRGEPSGHLLPTAFVSFLQNHDQVGNRAFGERLAGLVAEAPLKAVAATYLLAPAIPLLFMGEEWGSKRPFYYFCDVSADLSHLITEGRRAEFAKFGEAHPDLIPDPCVAETFESSKLDWHEREEPWHKGILQFYQRLLRIRKDEIIPKLLQWHAHGLLRDDDGRSCYQAIGERALTATWVMSLDCHLVLFANLSDSQRVIAPGHNTPLNPQSKKPSKKPRVIFETHENTLQDLSAEKMNPWSVVWTIT
jgi:malto-oligosyltrehalose trehalohydrolase